MNTIYNEFLNQLMLQQINLATDTLYVALFPAGYTADPDNHLNWEDVSASEAAGAGYTAGGRELTAKELVKQDEANNIKFIADDVSWPSSSIDAQYAVIYKSTGDPATSTIVLCLDFGSVKSSVNGTFTIRWADLGILTLSQAV